MNKKQVKAQKPKTQSKSRKNKKVKDIAITVKNIIGEDVEIIKTKTDDNRSYHISSEKIKYLMNYFVTLPSTKSMQQKMEKGLKIQQTKHTVVLFMTGLQL